MAATRTRPRRTQRERSDATTASLLEAARDLFAQDGYAATSLDAVCAAADVTKGALYHHFEGKRDLFLAVCEQEQRRLTESESAAFRSKKDPWEGFCAGCEAYLKAVIDPGVQQIMLLDAPGVLGWDTMREVETEAFEAAVSGLRRAMDAGSIGRRDPEPLMRILFGALCEAAMAIAKAEDQAAALRTMTRELRRVLDGLRV